MVAYILARMACGLVTVFYSYRSCIEHWLINDNS